MYWQVFALFTTKSLIQSGFKQTSKSNFATKLNFTIILNSTVPLCTVHFHKNPIFKLSG